LPAGWTDHRNSNTVAFLPPYLGKQYAVAHILIGLRARFPNATVIGIGDSITDAPFMQLCDFAMTPSASQLARAASAGLIGT
jgi:predicted mannosyl-3-phosphoglycerate phosphatase (HAD superfamily)